jgi:hypothetical protein
MKLSNKVSIWVYGLAMVAGLGNAYFAYKDSEGIQQCLRKADIVSASTDELSITLLENGASKVETIHNSIELLPYKEPVLSNRIAWRGSATHVADLEVYKDIFTRLSKKYELIFYGYAPHWKINFQFVNGTNLFDFYNTFYNDNIDFVLTPLENCKFNYAKSNIAWLEATNAGAACFTNLTTKEWQWESILKNPEILLTKSKDQLAKIHKQAYELSRAIILQQYNKEYEILKVEKILKKDKDKITKIIIADIKIPPRLPVNIIAPKIIIIKISYFPFFNIL